jgi:CheY-like chemotaxis protein
LIIVAVVAHSRILVVDDDAAILDSLRRALELEGYAVRTAVDGATALSSVAQSEPDAVVLDIGLPDLNGRAVAARMRAGGLSTPILVLSALDQVDDRIAGLEAAPSRPPSASAWSAASRAAGAPLPPAAGWGSPSSKRKRDATAATSRCPRPSSEGCSRGLRFAVRHFLSRVDQANP